MDSSFSAFVCLATISSLQSCYTPRIHPHVFEAIRYVYALQDLLYVGSLSSLPVSRVIDGFFSSLSYLMSLVSLHENVLPPFQKPSSSGLTIRHSDQETFFAIVTSPKKIIFLVDPLESPSIFL